MTLWTSEFVRVARSRLDDELPAAVELRHDLHAHPDVSGSEAPTAQRLLRELDAVDAPDFAGATLIRVGPPGPAVGLRTELDGLPVVERTGLPWAATGGVAHACGHDIHMAALVAVVRTLASLSVPLPVVAVLQPREETVPSGAADVVASGLLAEHQVIAMVAVHVQPRIPGGTFSAMPGAVNASSDDVVIRLHAQGGHAGYPHVTGDPIVAAAEIVTGAQAILTRRIDPIHPAVITFGSIHAGAAPNVIPDSAIITGTIRTFDASDRSLLAAKLRLVAEQAAARHDCSVSMDLMPGEPPLVNDPALSRLVDRWIQQQTAATPVDLRSCGSDDFSYYGHECPSTMVFYGTGDASPQSPGLHDARFAPPDADVGGVARCLLAAYFAACELLLGPPAAEVAHVAAEA